MDPDVALQALIDALVAGDVTTAREHFADLDTWLSGGGFPPSPFHTRCDVPDVEEQITPE